MSPRKDPNKVMDVLEKMRVVRKVGDDDSSVAPDPEYTPPSHREDIPEPRPAEQAEEFDQFFTSYSTDGEPTAEPEPEPEAPAFSVTAEKPYGIQETDSSLFFDTTPAEGFATDRYLDLDELYHSFEMKISGVDTIYLIESYIKTLPDTLPSELRRSIILQIVEASGFDFDALLNDGIDRVARLNDYSARFASRTEEIVERHNVEIDALERQVQQIRGLINERKNLHKRQFLSIESEARRLKEILDFITK